MDFTLIYSATGFTLSIFNDISVACIGPFQVQDIKTLYDKVCIPQDTLHDIEHLSPQVSYNLDEFFSRVDFIALHCLTIFFGG